MHAYNINDNSKAWPEKLLLNNEFKPIILDLKDCVPIVFILRICLLKINRQEYWKINMHAEK